MTAKIGDIRTTVEELVRRECSACGEPATCQVGYILANARTNPASKGYGRDDISWCSDDETWSCEACKWRAEHEAPDGYEWCSTFPGDKFPHMVTHWEKVSEEIVSAVPGE